MNEWKNWSWINLITKHIGELVYPPPLKQSWVRLSNPMHPYGTFPLQLDDVIGTERYGNTYTSGQRIHAIYLYTQLSSQSAELVILSEAAVSRCKKNPQVAAIGSAWQLLCGQLVEAVVVGKLGSSWLDSYSDKMWGIYLGVLIWWETCCLTCTWENGGRVSVASSCSSL